MSRFAGLILVFLAGCRADSPPPFTAEREDESPKTARIGDSDPRRPDQREPAAPVPRDLPAEPDAFALSDRALNTENERRESERPDLDETPLPAEPPPGGLLGGSAFPPSVRESSSIPEIDPRRVCEELARQGFVVEHRFDGRGQFQWRCVRRSDDGSREVVLSGPNEDVTTLVVATVVDLSSGGTESTTTVISDESRRFLARVASIPFEGPDADRATSFIEHRTDPESIATIGGLVLRLEAEGPRIFSLTILPSGGGNSVDVPVSSVDRSDAGPQHGDVLR